ncbi:UNVERIFIED_CONTAM: hypothetical protein PYX00_007613 [Menopon gallinae]|uniref:ARID domain-containing protein n=1 Tax=Menopon gallinae TaxID=328185 RepID=A0AAW2HKP7_9NEOP
MKANEPPYLSVGTEVSAKYKGAFCEAKVRKVDKTVKCKVSFKLGSGTYTLLDSSIKGTLRVGAQVEAKHPDRKEFVEATITKIQDCSQYTVVFDDGDITTLRRSALCLKSGRHFAESETLDQLPLTHPEHFGNPVVGGRRGRRRLLDDSSGDEDTTRKGKLKEEKEADIGKVVCVELGDKKKVKDNWFPGLVVSPNAQDTVQIRVKDEYLVRSFSDGRYYTVPKKEATEFTREIGVKVDNNTLKTAVEKALHFLDKDELPPHWDRELLFGLIESDMNSDSDEGLDSDSSDDEPREEKDHFVAQLYKFMDDRGTPINHCPSIGGKDLDLYKLFNVVHKLNGYNRVTNRNEWKIVSGKLGLGMAAPIITQVKHAYKRYLHSFEDFYRKLGCTMVSHPRSNRARNKSGRSLIRDKDRATPLNSSKVKSDTSPCDSSRPVSKQEDVPEKEAASDSKVKEEVNAEKKEEKAKAKEEDTEKVAKGKVARKEIEAEDVSESEDNVSTSEETVNRPSSSLRKKFPTLKASPVVVREKRKAENSPEERKCKRARMLKSRSNSSTDLKGGSDGEEDSKGKDASDQRSTTRSRSKEDVKLKKEIEKDRRNKSNSVPASEAKRGPIVKAKRQDSEDNLSQKKGRKRRNTDTGRRSPSVAEEDLNLPCLPSYKSVFIGDVLKIYYGAAGESKVIYEAKVVDIKENEAGETLYLVHYAGWNSRYDEWVKRNKIAENLNWTPARSKTTQSVKSVKASAQKRKQPANRSEQTGPGTRSTTPSSITSSSSRTKSPAASAQSANKRFTRNAGESKPKRTRRISGHTDISVDSESDSDPGESVSDVEVSKKKTGAKNEAKEPAARKKPEAKKTTPKRKLNRKAADKKPAEDEEDSAKTKKPKKKATPVKESDNASENSSEAEVKKEQTAEEEQEPKGRDFDLNQIRSELKGIDKAVKVSADLIRVDEVEEKSEEVKPVVAEETPEPKPSPQKEEEKPQLKPEEKTPEKKEVKDDIYEFKEPEPFEYQEALRPMNRMFDDAERSPEKLNKKAIIVIDKKDIPNFEGDMKSRFKKTIGKKMKELCVNERREPTVRLEKLDNVQKKFDTFQLKPADKEIPVLKVEVEPRKSVSPEPFGLFSSVREEAPETHAEVPADKPEPTDDAEGANPKSPQPSTLSPEPPSLTPMTNNVYVEEQATSPLLLRVEEVKQEEQKKGDTSQEEEDDPISAAIQRVIAQSSMDDDSDDMDLFTASTATNLPSTEPPDISKTNSVSSEPKTEVPINKKLCSKRKNVGKRMILSKEFVMDDDSSTDSDSDSAEERLVIVNEDESTDDSSHSQKPSAINAEEEKKVLVPPPKRSAEERKSPVSSENLSPKVNDASSTKKSTPTTNEDGWKSPKQEKVTEEEGESNLRSLLCEETIPGSPTPVVENKETSEPKLNLLEMQYASGSQPISLPPPPPPPAAKRDGNDAAAVMDNTPPTTPESNLSSISGSPREDRVGSSSLDNESSKSHRDSSEVDVDNEHQRMRGNKFPKKPEKDPESPLKKKRRNRKRSESLSENNKRIRQPVGRPPKAKDTGSDSDDTSENSQIGNNINSDPLMNSRSQRPSKYNFFCELDPELDATQRIALLEQKIQECRKTYLSVKSKLASIDRRRKKLRRREREGRRKSSRY